MVKRPSLCTANGALPPPPLRLQRAEGSKRRLHLKGPRPESGLWVERAAQRRGARYKRHRPQAPPYGRTGAAGGAAERLGPASSRPPVGYRCLAPRVGVGRARAARVPEGWGPPNRRGGVARAWRRGQGPPLCEGAGPVPLVPLPASTAWGRRAAGGRVPGTPP